MKYLRYPINVFLFTALCITTPLIAKKRKTTTQTKTIAPALPQKNEAYQKAAAKLPAKTYKQMLDDIRIMKPKDIVNEDGILTDSFVTFVIHNAKKTNLSPILTKSLLQAGMGLHGQLSDDNKIALQALSNNKKQIENVLVTLNPPPPQPESIEQTPELPPITPPITPIPQKLPQSQQQIPQSKKPQQPISTKPSIPSEEVLPPSPQPKLFEPYSAPTSPHPSRKASEGTAQSYEGHSKATKGKQLKGIADLHHFREQSAMGPIDNFYANNKINTQWLEKALTLVLDGAPLTSQNKDLMQGELVGTATELMREFLQKNKTDVTQRNKILEDVKNQVIIFMNAQQLYDQSPIQKPSITHKTPGLQPVLPQQKKPQADPISPDSKKLLEDTDIAPSKPLWLSDNNTLIAKTLEIEILNYIFKNQDATQKNTLNYFINQLPQGLKNKEDIISSMRTTIKKIFPEPEEKMPPAIPSTRKEIIPAAKTVTEEKMAPKKLPAWINKDNLLINVTQLKSEITSYIATHMDADNDEIINHFISQVPATYPHMEKIKRQVRVVVEDYFTN